MNLRWLFGNFTDPQYNITWREQVRLSNRAHAKHLPKRVFLIRTIVLLIPIMAMLIALKPTLTALGFGGQNGPYFIGLVVIVVVCWPWSAWMYRSMYIKPIRKVMREVGFDLCIECGYDLRGHDSTMPRCPECGAERQSSRVESPKAPALRAEDMNGKQS